MNHLRRPLVAPAGAAALLLTLAGVAQAASMAFDPPSGSPGSSATLTIRADTPPNPGARLYVNVIPRGSTITHDPSAWGIGEATFDASGVAVLSFVVPDRPVGMYETVLPCNACSEEFLNSLPERAIFEITAPGDLPNTAIGSDGQSLWPLVAVALLVFLGCQWRIRLRSE